MRHESIMVVLGEQKQIQTEFGVIRFEPSLECLTNGAYREILVRLVDGKRVRRAWRDADDRLHGSAVHSISKPNEDALRDAHPCAEWHYMKLAAYPVHVFVAVSRGIPVAIASPVTTRNEDFIRRANWIKQQDTAS